MAVGNRVINAFSVASRCQAKFYRLITTSLGAAAKDIPETRSRRARNWYLEYPKTTEGFAVGVTVAVNGCG